MAVGTGLDALERRKRAQTIASIARRALAILIWTTAVLIVLRELDVDITPVLTGAGIVGLAVGFGAQTLVRDVITGFFLIIEDQVRVGDVAMVNGTGGLVEQINLRTIVLRDFEGVGPRHSQRRDQDTRQPDEGLLVLRDRSRRGLRRRHRPRRRAGPRRSAPRLDGRSGVRAVHPRAGRGARRRRLQGFVGHAASSASRPSRSSSGKSAASCGGGSRWRSTVPGSGSRRRGWMSRSPAGTGPAATISDIFGHCATQMLQRCCGFLRQPSIVCSCHGGARPLHSSNDPGRVQESGTRDRRFHRRLSRPRRRTSGDGAARAGRTSRRNLPSAPPATSRSFDAILHDLDRIILPGLTHWQHPEFFGYFPCNGTLASVLGDYVSTGLGVLGLAWQSSPALTELEEVVTDWLRQMLGLARRVGRA